MKKNSFIEGTVIATICIILVKILGMVYVIPFYAIIGTQGAALYAYAYTIYGLFLEISTAGIPNAVGKIINEFNTLNKQEAKVRTFQIGKKLLGFIAIVAFIIMFVFANQIGSLILGDLSGGNTIEDVAFVIRCVSFALLIFPFLSVTRGFFQGHQVISVSSFSQVIEQVVRVTFIIVGSYIAIRILKLDIREAVGVAVFSAFVAGFAALCYVYKKLQKNKHDFHLDEEFKEKDAISNKDIIKKILKYAIPTVIISIALSIYNNVDMILILRTMDYLGYPAVEVEFISTAISTWASKISIIITSIGLGLAPSLVTSMVQAFTLNNYGEVNRKFNQALELTFFITVPMCVGISLLSSSIWTIFYGYNTLGATILAVSIFSPLFSNLFTISNYTLQSVNKYRLVYISAIAGILTNAILDVPCMLLLDFLGLPAYWGATMATIIGFSITVIIAMMMLKKLYQFTYKEVFNTIKNIFVPLIVMIVVVVLFKIIIPIHVTSRLANVLYVSVVAIVGACVYFIVSYKMGLIDHIFGENFLKKLKGKFIRNKKEV